MIYACNLNAMDAAQRKRYGQLKQSLFSTLKKVRELPNGFEFQFASPLLGAAEFISLERLCCPFLRLALIVEPGDGPILIQLTGEEDVKVFLRAELGMPISIQL